MVYTALVFVLGVTSLPLQFFVGVIIALYSGLPVLFSQRRVGKNGRIFTMYKFRTMIQGAEKKKAQYRRLNESDGPAFKIRNDPRFTLVGKWLSHTGLDELPQLWNVLRGDMALIGPRPLPVHEAEKLLPWMNERHTVLPGIISPAVLTGRYHKDFIAWMKSDVAYAKAKSLWQDAIILFRLVPFIGRLFFRAFL